MTAEDAANELGCSPALIYKLCTARKLSHNRVGCGRLRAKIVISPEQLAEYRRSTEVLAIDDDEPTERRAKRRGGVVVPDFFAEYRREKAKAKAAR